jgi:butyrate kinase
MEEKIYRILVINPGSTSTKLSLFENKKCAFEADVFHDSSTLLALGSINDQLDYRMRVMEDFLKKHDIDLTGLDAVVGRGGPCYPLESGTYEINEQMVIDTRNAVAGLYHASMLGVQMAKAVHDKYGARMFTVDPTVVDEYQDIARISGVKGVYRTPGSHVLNGKEAARRYAAKIGRQYEDCCLIVAHIDGGITIQAHDHGRMIDGNNGGGGEGPFTPTRMGSISAAVFLNQMKDVTHQELQVLCSEGGGLSSWFQTSNSDKVHDRVEAGDPKAVMVWNAMIYQICKWIGAMACVLEGHVDGIVLTGGLLRFSDIEEGIRKRCGWIAPVVSFPGEFEQEALAFNALKVLRGEMEPKHYTGRPVFTGFSWDKGKN